MIRFLEANGYDVSYMSGLDVATSRSLLLNHKMFLSIGARRVLAGQQRANVEAARDAGVNLAFFSGNEVFWKTGWEPSIDGSNTPNRTLVTLQGDALRRARRPAGPADVDGHVGGPAVQPAGGRGRPQNALTGQLFDVNSGTTDITGARAVRQAEVLAEHRGRQSVTGSQTTTLGRASARSATSGTSTSTTGSGRPGCSTCPRPRCNTAEVFTDYGGTHPAEQHRRRTT